MVDGKELYERDDVWHLALTKVGTLPQAKRDLLEKASMIGTVFVNEDFQTRKALAVEAINVLPSL